jgi:hypothetical protein
MVFALAGDSTITRFSVMSGDIFLFETAQSKSFVVQSSK